MDVENDDNVDAESEPPSNMHWFFNRPRRCI